MSAKKIEVFLNIGGNPEVILDRDISGFKKNKIQWVRGDGEDFEFMTLNYWSDGCLSNKDEKPHKIEADNDSSNTGEHEYVIRVRSEQGEHSTTVEGPPTGDKPVIRN